MDKQSIDRRSIEKYVGQRFGKIVVTGVAQRGRRGVVPKLYGRCDCGGERVFGKAKLVSGKTQSCGCLTASIIPPGTMFGAWTVLDKVVTHTGGKDRYYFKCRCVCGIEAIRDGRTLKTGMSTSCGCVRNLKCTLPDKQAAFNEVLAGYKKNAATRGCAFDLTETEVQGFLQANCVYCGSPPMNVSWHHRVGRGPYVYNGIDRVDNSMGYSKTNCVTACKVCNRMKTDRDLDDFLSWAKRIQFGCKSFGTATITEAVAKHRQRAYRHRAKKRGLSYSLTLAQVQTLLGGSCRYCGAAPSNSQVLKNGTRFHYNGIDRVDNSRGYDFDNCCTCCAACNRAKAGMTRPDFLAHVHRIASHRDRRLAA